MRHISTLDSMTGSLRSISRITMILNSVAWGMYAPLSVLEALALTCFIDFTLQMVEPFAVSPVLITPPKPSCS